MLCFCRILSHGKLISIFPENVLVRSYTREPLAPSTSLLYLKAANLDKMGQAILHAEKTVIGWRWQALSWRNLALQGFILIVLLGVGGWLAGNVSANLRAAQIASGFDFLMSRAGFPLSVSFIPYHQDASFLRALAAGLVNSVVMALMTIIAATILGIGIGIGRLSRNWLMRNCCLAYVEIFRNLPPILVILFCYFGLFQEFLPAVAHSVSWMDSFYINQRGFYFPYPMIEKGIGFPIFALFIGVMASLIYKAYRHNQHVVTGRRPLGWPIYAVLLGFLPLAAMLAFTQISGLDMPRPSRFNITGGASLRPEMLALFLALSLYSAALISETVRAGVSGVDEGVQQAAQSLGLRRGLVLRLVTMPLALRIIIPPLASQYMNIVKNTSLAVAIGYQDFMSIGNSIIEKTNQSVEVVVIWLLVYLGLSLIVSVAMNWFNHKMALKGR